MCLAYFCWCGVGNKKAFIGCPLENERVSSVIYLPTVTSPCKSYFNKNKWAIKMVHIPLWCFYVKIQHSFWGWLKAHNVKWPFKWRVSSKQVNLGIKGAFVTLCTVEKWVVENSVRPGLSAASLFYFFDSDNTLAERKFQN